MLESVVNSFREAKQFVKDGFGIMFCPVIGVASEIKNGKYILAAYGIGIPAVSGYFFWEAFTGDLPAAALGAACLIVPAYGMYGAYKEVLKPNLNEVEIEPEDLENKWRRKLVEIYARRNGRLAEYKGALERLAASG